MEFFALDEEVVDLEQRIADGQGQLENLVALAWHKRQRDCQAAKQLMQTAQEKLQSADFSRQQHCHGPQQTQLLRLRLALVDGEMQWLEADLQQAAQLASTVLRQSKQFIADRPLHQGKQSHQALTETKLGNTDVGDDGNDGYDADAANLQARRDALQLQADAHWLLGWVHNERGQAEARDGHWQQMRETAHTAGDRLRAEFADACLASMVSFRSSIEAEPLAQKYFATDLSQYHPALLAAIYDFLGLQVRMGSDLGRSAAYWMHSFEASCKTGQIRRAVIAASNIGNIFTNLNDHNTALEWMERALALARPTGWPGSIGNCLMHTASCLRQVGRIDAAQEMLEEALNTMQKLHASRNYAIALWFLGDLAIDRKDYLQALDAFKRLQERADALLQSDFQTNSRRGQAQALALLQRYDEALAIANTALALGREQNDVYGQIETLKVLANIHAQKKLPAPVGISENTAQLHYLMQALKLASEIDGYTIPADLLDEIADAHAGAGNFGKAFAFGRRANGAREKTNHLATTNRALALQVQHQTERARAEGEHLRQLAHAQAQRAAAEERRAQILQDTTTTLSHLSAIGQEITAQLDIEAVFHALTRHVNSLLDANYLAIFLAENDEQHLQSIFRLQDGKLLGSTRIEREQANSYAAQSLRERREIAVTMHPEQENPALASDTNPTLSALFGPLLIGNRMLGVMTIQSAHMNAYDERERLIFRNLCAYGAIALDNANAYTRLQEAQQKLVAQEKLAALGSLVAGVAHELNTPLGNSLVALSGMRDHLLEVEQKLQAKKLSLQDLQSFLSDSKLASGMVLQGLHSAANLVTSFKQVAVDRTSAQIREFDLLQTTQETITTMNNQIRQGGHLLQVDIAADIWLHSYPGPYGQVIASLINNAITHAFHDRAHGQMHISARQIKRGWVTIHFQDNGVGIAVDHRKHIFDPFFTTRMGQGSSGLGLSICYNIVTSLLQGQIWVQSELGKGSLFVLEMPLNVAPS